MSKDDIRSSTYSGLRMTKEKSKELFELIGKNKSELPNMTLKEIANKYKVSTEFARSVLGRLNVSFKTHPHLSFLKGVLSEEDIEEAKALVLSGANAKKLASHFNLSVNHGARLKTKVSRDLREQFKELEGDDKIKKRGTTIKAKKVVPDGYLKHYIQRTGGPVRTY